MPDRSISGRLVAGLFEKGLTGGLTPELEAHLAAAGIDLSKLAPSYPYDTWVRGLEITAAEVYGGEVLSEALRKLGVQVVNTLKDSGLVNGPLLTMGRLLGPKRVLSQISGKQLRGATFLRIDVHEKAGKHLEVHLNEGAIGDFISGGLEAALELLGGRRPRIQALVTTPERCVLDVTWS